MRRVSAAYSVPPSTTSWMSISLPPIVMVESPEMATLGTLVRSPESFLMGRPGIVPVMVISRWALLRALVVGMACCSNPDASGSASVGFDDEQPDRNRAVAAKRAARTANIRRHVGMGTS